MHRRYDRHARPDRPQRAAGLLILTLVNSACGAGWHRPDPLPSGALPPRQQVQVWQGGRARQWHAVRLEADSISGIPFIASPDCDSCRVSVPRAAVDSLRLGSPVRGLWGNVALGLGAAFLITVVACAAARSCNFTD
jgi:hypothetical protein